MKRTFPINLSGKVFYIDEDAYSLLDDYLNNIRAAFSSPDDSEIADDIEARISELFSEKIDSGSEVITIADVNAVIDRIGRPEQMGDGDSQYGGRDNGRQTPPPPPSPKEPQPQAQPQQTVRKRLFRDPDDKILGGVASGIALYLGWNATLVRLALVLFALLGYGIVIALYIAAWIVIPQAKTAEDRLAMYGKPVNLDNIGQTVKEGYNRASAQVQQAMNRRNKNFWDYLVDIIGWCIKIGLVLIAICMLPVVIAMFIGLVAVVVGIIATAVGAGAVLAELPFAALGTPELGFAACSLLLGLITIIAIIWGAGCAVFKWRGPSNWLIWTSAILWILSAAGAFICFAVTGFDMPAMGLTAI